MERGERRTDVTPVQPGYAQTSRTRRPLAMTPRARARESIMAMREREGTSSELLGRFWLACREQRRLQRSRRSTWRVAANIADSEMRRIPTSRPFSGIRYEWKADDKPMTGSRLTQLNLPSPQPSAERRTDP